MVEDIVKDELRKGPKTWTELQEACDGKGIPKQTFSRHFTKMRDIDKSVYPSVRVTARKRPQIEYEWISEEFRGTVNERAEKAIGRFLEITGRYPDLQELALEMRATFQEAEKAAYETTAKTGWRPPKAEEISRADNQLGGALYVAALIQYDPKRLENLRASITQEEIQSARKILTTHPELVPKFEDGKLKWPEETNRYLRMDYDPTKRPAIF